jgi:hypothetical protein
MANFNLDPWGTTAIVEDDYARLIKEFRIEEITETLRQKMM